MALYLAEVIARNRVDCENFFWFNRELAAGGQEVQDSGDIKVTFGYNADPDDVDTRAVAYRTSCGIPDAGTTTHDSIQGAGRHLDATAIDNIVSPPADAKNAFGRESTDVARLPPGS